MESGWGPLVLAKHLQGPVLQVQYRLAVDMSVGFRACFPAALQDGLTAYSYVINELGVPPGNVVLSGESAGANLVIAMLRYLSSDDGKGTLPLPRAGLLWSPWVNLVPNQLTLDEHQNGRSDYMKGSILEWGASLFTPHGFDRRNPYISPLGNEFKSPVPLFVHSGTAEVLHDEHVSFAKAMRTCGTELEFLESENAPHDIFGAGIILGFVDEAEVAVQKAIAFVERVTHSHNE
jgi:acetyl esterase/lipase